MAAFHRGALDRSDYVAIHRALDAVSVYPFAYLQVRYHDVKGRPRPTLIPGQYAIVHGTLGDGRPWEYDEAELQAVAAALTEQHAAVVLGQAEDWSSAVSERRPRQIRLMLTKLKPALRAVLVSLGEPALATWADSYDGLARRLAGYDRPLAEALAEVLAELPAPPERQRVVGETLLEVLARLGHHRP